MCNRLTLSTFFVASLTFTLFFFSGVILRERGSAVTEDQARELQVDRKFSTFIAWNLDKPCSDDDKLHKALQWINIAKAVRIHLYFLKTKH